MSPNQPTPIPPFPKKKATGWLGLLLGTKLWYKYTQPEHYNTVLEGVIKELTKSIGPPGATHGTPIVCAHARTQHA